MVDGSILQLPPPCPCALISMLLRAWMRSTNFFTSPTVQSSTDDPSSFNDSWKMYEIESILL